jgi:hypothetical protein
MFGFRSAFLSCVLLVVGDHASAQTPPAPLRDFHTSIMDSTFETVGRSRKEPDKLACGTGFLMGTATANPNLFNPVLVTAGHVFEDIAGETARFVIRTRKGSGALVREVATIKIRVGAQALYAKHPTADVAVIYASLPRDHFLTVGFPYCSQITDPGYGILRKVSWRLR